MPDAAPARRQIGGFERWLTLWVALCMAVGVLLGTFLPGATAAVRDLEFGRDSRINLPIAVLIWLMIYPMMLRIDFSSLLGVRKRPGGILITLVVNWLVKPFSMALLGWLFISHLFRPLQP
jgi:ACR3 family arsenite transporter